MDRVQLLNRSFIVGRTGVEDCPEEGNIDLWYV